MDQDWLTVADAALRLHYTRDHVRLLCRRGTLIATFDAQLHHPWRIDPASVTAYGSAHPKPGPKPKSATAPAQT